MAEETAMSSRTRAIVLSITAPVLAFMLVGGVLGRAMGREETYQHLKIFDDVVSLITERRVSRPWGLAGGEPGAVGENWLLRAGDESRAERLQDKCTVQLRAGDVLRMLTPGGGGWGTPVQR